MGISIAIGRERHSDRASILFGGKDQRRRAPGAIDWRRQCCAASDRAHRPQGQAGTLAREPARPRLVHLLSRRRADRFRAVHCGLSDDPEMDPGRDRLCAVDRRHHRVARADAGRRHRRCGALGADGGGPCGGDHRHVRAVLCGVADLPGGGGGGHAARARKLRARPGDCRDQPRPGRAAGDRRTARAQCAVRLARQRFGGGTDGRLRLLRCRAGRCFWSRSCWRSRPCWRSRASASARSTSRRPMVRSRARCPIPRRPACSASCASVRC